MFWDFFNANGLYIGIILGFLTGIYFGARDFMKDLHEPAEDSYKEHLKDKTRQEQINECCFRIIAFSFVCYVCWMFALYIIFGLLSMLEA